MYHVPVLSMYYRLLYIYDFELVYILLCYLFNTLHYYIFKLLLCSRNNTITESVEKLSCIYILRYFGSNFFYFKCSIFMEIYKFCV